MFLKTATTFAAALVCLGQVAAAGTYEIDASHAAINFKVSHLGFSNTSGSFPGISGTIHLDEEDINKSSVEVTIDPASVDTNNEDRDAHLKNEDFFNVEKHDSITFKSTAWKKTGDKTHEVTGDLTLLGTTKPVTLTVTELGSGKNHKGEEVRGFETEYKLKRSDFGMDKMVGPIGDEVTISISLEAVKS